MIRKMELSLHPIMNFNAILNVLEEFQQIILEICKNTLYLNHFYLK